MQIDLQYLSWPTVNGSRVTQSVWENVGHIVKTVYSKKEKKQHIMFQKPVINFVVGGGAKVGVSLQVFVIELWLIFETEKHDRSHYWFT